VRDNNGQALAEEPGRNRKQALSLLRRSGPARQTFSLGSFLKDENSVSEWPGARDCREEPLSHCPRRGCAFLFPLIRRTGDPLLNALPGLSIIRQHATTILFPHFVAMLVR
jgi:hypothetical protein